MAFSTCGKLLTIGAICATGAVGYAVYEPSVVQRVHDYFKPNPAAAAEYKREQAKKAIDEYMNREVLKERDASLSFQTWGKVDVAIGRSQNGETYLLDSKPARLKIDDLRQIRRESDNELLHQVEIK